jgi:hypothetical protein
MDAYGKSGHGNVLSSHIYADDQKNTEPVSAPCLSFIAESAPKILFNELSDAHISDGFLPRIIVVQYTGDREYMNEKPRQLMDDFLSAHLINFADTALGIESQNQVRHVKMSPEATEMFRELDRQTTDAINRGGDETSEEINNRAHLNSMKIAAILAIYDNPTDPMIDAISAMWSIDFVRRCGVDFWQTYAHGSHGPASYSREIQVVKKAVLDFQNMTPERRKMNNCPGSMVHQNSLIPITFLRHKILRKEEFRILPGRGKKHLDDIVADMIEQEILVRVVDCPTNMRCSLILSHGPRFND